MRNSLQFMTSVVICNYLYSGVDIVGILESLSLSERYLDMLRESGAGHWAVAYALYKIFTPIRYTVTLGKFYDCDHSSMLNLFINNNLIL